MIRSLVVASILLTGCSRSDEGETHGIEHYKMWRDTVCQEFDPSTITRCDRATFHVLMNAMCNKPLPTEYEYPSGKWNRDVKPCYPDDSSSETSFDTYLSVKMARDDEAMRRVVAYAQPLDWQTGLPAGGVGNIAPLIPLMGDYIQRPETLNYEAISGFRGHLIAGWLWEWAHLNGGLNAGETEILRQLHKKTPSSPYFSCLYRRFSGKDQQHTLSLMENINANSNFGWGSSKPSIFVALSVACLEGR
jgi:hypothetical protein